MLTQAAVIKLILQYIGGSKIQGAKTVFVGGREVVVQSSSLSNIAAQIAKFGDSIEDVRNAILNNPKQAEYERLIANVARINREIQQLDIPVGLKEQVAAAIIVTQAAADEYKLHTDILSGQTVIDNFAESFPNFDVILDQINILTAQQEQIAETLALTADQVDAALVAANAAVTDALAAAAASLSSSNSAATFANSASTSASSATSSASSASISAGAAAASQTTAGGSAVAAAASASSASTSSDSAGSSATAASASAVAASVASTNASNSASASATSASSALASQTAAGSSASSATTSATNAATSAGAANTSAGSASTSATSASASASTATTQANSAQTSATNAANSSTAAGGSASASATSASLAGTYSTAAGVSAVAAETSRLAAETASGTATASASASASSAVTASNAASTATTQATLSASFATTASGAATTATTQASVSTTQAGIATAAGATATSAATLSAAYANTKGNLIPNGDFESGPTLWTSANISHANSSFYGNIWQHSNSLGGTLEGPLVKIDPSRRFRAVVTWIQQQGNTSNYAGLVCYNAAGNNLGNIYFDSVVGQIFPFGYFYSKEQVYQGINPALPNPAYAAGGQFPPNTVAVRPLVLSNYTVIGTAVGLDWQSFEMLDITESATASNSASVATTQAATATASASSASTNASLSASYRDTALGHANTASSQATISTSQAAISTAAASSATTSSNLSATYRDQSQGYANTSSSQATVATNQAAISTAAAASASASSLLTASYTISSLLMNPVFANYPTGAGYPPGIAVYGATGTLTRVIGINGQGYGVQWDAAPGAVAGIAAYGGDGSNPGLATVRAGWYVVEVDFKIRLGRLNGFQTYLSIANNAGTEIEAFGTLFDSSAENSDLAAPGEGVTGRVYSYKFLYRVTSTTAAYADLYFFNFGGDAGQGKHPTVYKLSMRPATPSEIQTKTVLEPTAATVATHSSQISALATADAAIVSSTTTLIASIAHNSLGQNSSFADWPGGSGTYPANWGAWSFGDLNTRVAGDLGGYAYQQDTTGRSDMGIVQAPSGMNGKKSAGWYVMEADVTLVSGSLVGASMYAGNTDGAHSFTFSNVINPITGVAYGVGTVGKRYKFTRIFQKTGTTTDWSLYAMSNWSGYVTANKVIKWHKAVIRDATAAEIRDQTVLAPMEATVATQASAITTLNGSVASLTNTVSTQGVSITSNATAITTTQDNVTTLFGRAGVKVDVNGRMTGWEINNNGTTGDFVISADTFRIEKPGTGERTVYSSGAWKIYDSSNVLRVKLGNLA